MVWGVHYAAQVFAWMVHHQQPFPEGKKGCHSCDNPICVNPAHVWPGTQRENVLDAMAKGRMRPFGGRGSAGRSAVTECVHGHAFTPENTRIGRRGWRVCRTCERERVARDRKAFRLANPIPPRTHCKNGHLLDDANTLSDRFHRRLCRICTRATQRKNYHRRKAA